MGPQKKKDMMSDSFDSFWQSGNQQVSTKQRTSEDDSYDALWGRGNFAPAPKTQYVAPQNTRPIQTQPTLTQKQHYELLKDQQAQRHELMRQRFNMQRAQQEQQAIGAARASKAIGGLFKGTVRAVAEPIKYHTASASVKAKREKAKINERLNEMNAKRKLETYRKANVNLTKARVREKVYNVKQNINTAKEAFRLSK